MWKRLLDEGAWHGKAIKPILGGAKICVVLVFFFGIFVVIAVDSLVHRWRRRPRSA